MMDGEAYGTLNARKELLMDEEGLKELENWARLHNPDYEV